MSDLTPGSPEWWVDRLSRKLEGRRQDYERLEAYESGDHPLPEGDERARDLFKVFQRKARTNLCGLAVSSVRERLKVVGFRTGGSSTNEVDKEAWRIWQANHLDADSDLVHDAALTYRDAYVIVGPNVDDDSTPLITAESPLFVIGEPDPTNRRRMLAGLKTWLDEVEGVDRAILYLPDSFHYFTRATAQSQWVRTTAKWEPADVEGEPITNPTGVVPLVRFVNRPKLRQRNEGRAEFEDAIDIQDRINNVVLDRLVIGKMQAYRQRWAKGVNLTEIDEDGNEIPLDLPFVPGVDLLWAVEDEGVEFGEFAPTDLTPILKAVQADVTAFVTVTGLPPHYVAGDLVNAAADAIAAAEARLDLRTEDHQGYFGESWEQVIELAYRWTGKDIASDTEVVWRPARRTTDAQLADAAVKKDQAGVPWRQRMEDLGYSPPQIERMETDRTVDALVRSLAAPTSAGTPGQLAPAFQQPGQASTAGSPADGAA